MRNITPRKLTVFSVGLFFILSMLFFWVNYSTNSLIVSLSISVPILITTYVLLFDYVINRYIQNKIKPIYKTINSFIPNLKQKNDRRKSDDVFNQVDKEVSDWIQDKAMEVQQLRQMEKYRKEFIGNVSHELKTPIFNIQGYILTLLEGGIDDADINMLYLQRTEKSINRMITIIEDLDSISKLERGELEVKKEPFNIIQLIEDVYDLQEIRASKKNIKLVLNKSGLKQLMVNADKKWISQVISNLLVNSINYGKKNGHTRISLYDMDDHILVEVKDNGIGIQEADLPRIFERFYRADKSRSREQGGTGLGLAICKHIIDAHRQTLNVNSRVNKGTSFTFTLEKAT